MMIKTLPANFATLAITAWVGGLWAIGYLAVPILFQSQPDRQLAGMLAGQMFTALGYVGIVCGSYLLIHRVSVTGKAIGHQFWMIVAMLLITLLLQFWIQPMMVDMKAHALPLDVMQSPLSDAFKRWHGVSSILYLLESLLGGYLLLKRVTDEEA
ncbi:MAG: DUF4149 domain-containing protein [Gallionella sp.]|nr:DUF4149 domain-containing protein [Gallionella sp.]MDD4959894.1 DUF4149 domain-containing protein [Gallionella sp.]